MDGSLAINIALAILSAVFFVNFLKLKKNNAAELQKYEEELEEEIAKRKEIESKYQIESQNLKNLQAKSTSTSDHKTDEKTLNSLLFEVETLHKEKNEEMKLRLDAEKQIALALQKTRDVGQRIEDWKSVQDATLKDATEVIMKVGNDLYQRLIQSHRIETEETRVQIQNTFKNIYDYLEKIVGHVQYLNEKNIDGSKAVNTAIAIDKASTKNEGHTFLTLEDILKSAGLKGRVNYFMQYMLSGDVKKTVPCEAFVVIDKNNALVIDIKSLKFFQDLTTSRSRNEADATEVFKQKIDRYISYLANPKYKSNVINYFSAHDFIGENVSINLIMLVPSEKEIQEFVQLGNKYSEELQKNNIALHSLNSITKIIFQK